MAKTLDFNDKIGILDPQGNTSNPLNNSVYTPRYKEIAKIWSTYPTYDAAENFFNNIENNQLIFIISGTGSGKTVLIPKFSLHYFNYNGKIAVTLPKRKIALSAATYAAVTLDVTLGNEIGYAFKGSPKDMNKETNKILYMTDGFLVMKFIEDPLLNEFSCIIIDEAHERKVQIDILMLLLKKLLLSGKRPDLKVIFMSATIDGNKYQKYFIGIKNTIMNISGMPLHKIDVHFLREPTKSYISDGQELITNLINTAKKRNDILFFITTSNEAIQLCKYIKPKFPNVYCIEVFADMDPNLQIYAESRDNFLELGNYNLKIVMATNVAESSLTIDGLKIVIDSGYELYSHFDPQCYGTILEKRLITKAQALQRRGRVGRTEPGECFHLLTEDQFNKLESFPAPDILRQDITSELLKIIQSTESKTLKNGLELLDQLMDPPIQAFKMAALNIMTMYKIIDEDDNLTRIGYDLNKFSSMPINRTLFLIYSFQLYCAKEASIILAMIDVVHGKFENLFQKNIMNNKLYMKKIEKIVRKKGDHFTFLNIFQEYMSAEDKKKWTEKMGIKFEVLNNAKKKAYTYYNKIKKIINAPKLSRNIATDTKKNIKKALELSHRHLIAKKMSPLICKKKIEGQISKTSSVYIIYKKKDLQNKTFIYDELTNINGSWEYNTVTFL